VKHEKLLTCLGIIHTSVCYTTITVTANISARIGVSIILNGIHLRYRTIIPTRIELLVVELKDLVDLLLCMS
jgi:hypothetical protein